MDAQSCLTLCDLMNCDLRNLQVPLSMGLSQQENLSIVTYQISLFLSSLFFKSKKYFLMPQELGILKKQFWSKRYYLEYEFERQNIKICQEVQIFDSIRA